MFKKTLSTICIFLFTASILFSQRRTVTEKVYAPLDATVHASNTFSYTVDENGKRVLNGPLTIVGKEKGSSYRYSETNLDGKVDGLVTASGVDMGCLERFTFSGTFSKGVPNGKFSARRTDLYGREVMFSAAATYSQGHPIGAFVVRQKYWNYDDDREREVDIKGNFDPQGRMTGRWKYIHDYDRHHIDHRINYYYHGIRVVQADFVNNVCVWNYSDDEEEMTDAQVELAKKYARGMADRDELGRNFLLVMRDSLALGYDLFNDTSMRPDGGDGGEISYDMYVYFEKVVPVKQIDDDKFNWVLGKVKESGYGVIDIMTFEWDDHLTYILREDGHEYKKNTSV